MPGVRPSESWRDWNEQSFSQSGREGGGGVFGGVFISKFHSQSHAASHVWTHFVGAASDGLDEVRAGLAQQLHLSGTPHRATH
jgi:hypothetical protein